MINNVIKHNINVVVVDNNGKRNFIKEYFNVISSTTFSLIIAFNYNNKPYSFDCPFDYINYDSLEYFLNRSETNNGIRLIKHNDK